MPMVWFDELKANELMKIQKPQEILFVGSFGHPPNVDGLNWFLESIFPSIVEACPGVNLIIVGSNCPPEFKSKESDNITVAGYLTEEELKQAYLNARLSIVPLRYGAGVKGKVLESMQFNVPVVTTPIGAEGLLGEPNEYLSVNDSESTYASEIVRMLNDDDYCMEKVFGAQDALSKYYSKKDALECLELMTAKI